MNDQQIFGDEDLTAYLDGEADTSLAQRIEAALAVDRDLAVRLESLSIDVAAIKGTFDSLLTEAPAPPTTIVNAPGRQSDGAGFQFRAVAGIALVCLSVGGYFGSTFQKNNETWQEYAAAYHSLYVTNTLSNVQKPVAVSRRDLGRVAELLGKEIDFDIVSGLDQLDYKRAQMLGFDGKPLVQIAFMTKQGAPVALCIYPAPDGVAQPMASERMLGMSSAAWIHDGFEYLLVGGTDDALIESAAGTIRELL